MYDVGNKNAMTKGGGVIYRVLVRRRTHREGGCKKRTIAYKGGRGC